MMKFLVIRMSSIGDIVLTTPVLRCLRNTYPDAEIHWLLKEPFRTVLENNPYITQIHSFRKSLSEVLPELKKERFDHVIDLHKNFRSLRTRFALGRPYSTFPKLNYRKYLLTRFKINRLPENHVAERYFEAVKILGVQNDQKGLDFFLRNDLVFLSGLLPDHFRQNYIAWVIGGKFGTKIYPASHIVSVCQKLNYPVVLLGGKEDEARGEEIASACSNHVMSLCGKVDLHTSALLVKEAAKVVTNDTGLMHIAAAFRKPILSLWGNTVPAFGMYPYLPGTDKEKSLILEVTDLPCRPCSKIGFSECPKKHFDCMNRIPEDSILNWLQS